MSKATYLIKSFINAAGVFIYITAIAWFLFNGKNFFGNDNNWLVPVFMLLLFVISAAITGLLVLGKPAHLYFTGMKKEAVILLFATLAWLVVFLVLVMAILIVK